MTFFSDPIHSPFFFEGDKSRGALLLHGFPGTPAEVRPLGEALARAGIASRGILLPGFGPEIPELGQKTRRDWLSAGRRAWEEVREAHSRPILIGYSMGAALALHLAVEHPPERLVLLAPFWRFSMTLAHWFLPLIALFKPTVSPLDFGADLDDPGLRAEIRRMAPNIDLDDPAVRQDLREQLVLPTTVLDEVRRLGLAAYRLAPAYDRQVLVLQGAADEVVLPRFTQQLVTRLEKRGAVRYVEVAGDHEFPKEDGPVLDQVVTFIQQDSTGRRRDADGHLVA